VASRERPSEALLSAGCLAWPELLTRLAEPFPVEVISWRAGSISRDKKRAQALPYAEPRVYEDRLNALCPGLWSVAFKPWSERIICELTIGAIGPGGTLLYATRASTGESGDGFAPGTAAEAQAFKRACSKFGLGRYLYDVPIVWVDYDDANRKLLQTPKLPARFVPRSSASAEGPMALTWEPQAFVERPEPSTEAPQARSDPASLGRAERAAPAGASGARLLPPPETQAPATPPATALTPARAEAMHRELEKLGFSRSAQRQLAKSVLGRDVAAFDQLLESEAIELWNAARRVPTPRRAAGF
jgi:hypothetical protein